MIIFKLLMFHVSLQNENNRSTKEKSRDSLNKETFEILSYWPMIQFMMCTVILVALNRNSPLILKRLVLSARLSYFFPLQAVNKRKYSTKYYITDRKITPAGVKSLECVILLDSSEKTSKLSDVHFKSQKSPHCSSVTVQTDHQPHSSVTHQRLLFRQTAVKWRCLGKTLSLLVCFVSCAFAVIRSDGDMEDSHLGGGAKVTCSWPHCWTPGRHPWCGWREMNTQPLQLLHGSETLNRPTPIWTAKRCKSQGHFKTF